MEVPKETIPKVLPTIGLANSPGDAIVDVQDVLATHGNLHSFWDPADIDDLHDFNRDRRVVKANEMFRRTFGEPRGEHCYRLFKQRRTECEDCPAAKTFVDGRSHTSRHIGQARDGSETHYVVSTAPLLQGDGETTHVIEMALDVTELTALEAQLQHAHVFRQALVARRQEDFSYEAQTEVWFEPEHFQQMAGLICYYNASKFHYLYISRDDEVGKHLAVMSCEGELLLDANFPDYADRIPLPEGEATRTRGRRP